MVLTLRKEKLIYGNYSPTISHIFVVRLQEIEIEGMKNERERDRKIVYVCVCGREREKERQRKTTI